MSRGAGCRAPDWRPAWRVELVPSYKKHRVAHGEVEEVPASLERQVPVLLEVLAAHADPAWTPEVARAWWSSVTTVLHWMLRGAAVATAVAAEELLDSEAAPIDTRTGN